MSKELEAFYRVKREAGTPYFSTLYDIDMWNEDLSIIETALKEQEEDKKLLNEQAKSNRYLMEQIKQSQKKLKALEIIKEKGRFISLEYDEYHDKYYIYDNELYMHNEITKEEYDLLKEVLI